MADNTSRNEEKDDGADGTEDEEDDIVILPDLDGNEVEYQFLGVMEVEGVEYALLTPNTTEEEDAVSDATEIFIFTYKEDEDGNEVFSEVGDEATFAKVCKYAEKFLADEEEDEN